MNRGITTHTLAHTHSCCGYVEPSTCLEEDKNKVVPEGGAVGVVSDVITAFGDITKGLLKG